MKKHDLRITIISLQYILLQLGGTAEARQPEGLRHGFWGQVWRAIRPAGQVGRRLGPPGEGGATRVPEGLQDRLWRPVRSAVRPPR